MMRSEAASFVLFWILALMAAAVLGIWSTFAIHQWFIAAFGIFMFSVNFWLLTPILAGFWLNNYFDRHVLTGDYHRIDLAYTKTVGILHKLPVQKSLFTATIASQLGVVKLFLGDYDSAEILFREALAVAKSNWCPKRWQSVFYCNIGAMSCSRKNYVEAELYFEQALEFLQKNARTGTAFLSAYPHLGIGMVRLDLDELASAEEHLLKSLELLDQAKMPTEITLLSVDRTISYCNLLLALVYARKNELPRSRSCCDQFFERDLVFQSISKETTAIEATKISRLTLLAEEYLKHGWHERSERLLEIAYSLARECPFHPDAAPMLACFEKVLIATNRQSDISDMRRYLRPVNLVTTQEHPQR